MKEEWFYIVITGIIAVALCVGIITLQSNYAKYVVDMGKMGYCETTIQGSDAICWQKCK